MSIIGLTGYAQSGKDTAAAGLIGLGWERRAFADALRGGLYVLNPYIPVGHKESAALGKVPSRTSLADGGYLWTGVYRLQELVNQFGWDLLKVAVPEVRRLQQVYGTEAGRDIHGENCWVDALARTMEPGVNYVVTDVRFPNEVEDIHSLGGKVVRIQRPGVVAVNAHVSDDIDRLRVDWCISNNGAPWELKSELVKYAIGDDRDAVANGGTLH